MSQTPVNEESIRSFWKENGIFEASIKKNKNNKPYMLYDGPPFATGLPHCGHLLTLTIKDTVQRYFAQMGYHVERRGGWDCHGLPIEHEINKSLNMQAHEAVEKLGVSGYNQACRDIVMRYRKEWQSTINRLGRWIDFDNDYKTMDPEYMESVWWAFAQIWNKGLIYQGKKVMPFSTSLQTPLSNFEAGSNYQMVQDPAITVLVHTQDNTGIAIWTTTPWTLPANQAIAVNPELTYALIQHPDFETPFWICKEQISALFAKTNIEIIEEKAGQSLIGMRYQPLFNLDAEPHEKQHTIISGDFVETGVGTGFVHLAPAFGEDDHAACVQQGIKNMICPINHQGIYTDSLPMCSGQYIKEADKTIIKDLKERGQLIKQDVIEHNYPFCPRSDTPLIYMAVPSWFMSVSSIQDKLVASNEQINWVPEHIKHGRFGKWIANAKDWALSRNRVWGTPIPLWINNETGNIICIDSLDSLQKHSNQRPSDLHREHVDPIEFSIPGEPGVYKRVPEVLDCWFESGAMPYAKMHYPFKNKEQFEASFPAQSIAEGLDQTRGWFYTLTVLSTVLFDKPAFENVIVSGIVMAEDGKKMSKRLRNYTPPDELISIYGADALRLYLISSNLVKGEEQRFSDDGVKQMCRSTLIPLLSALKFFQTYADIDQWKAQEKFNNLTPLDQWVLSRLQSLKALVHENMEQYKLYLITPQLLSFIEELTNTYIRMNRSRYWGNDNTPDKQDAYEVLYTVLYEIALILTPFTPYMAEHVFQALKSYQNIDTHLSAHLCEYPQPIKKYMRPQLEEAVSLLQEILNMGRAKRVEANIRIKTPLSELTVVHHDAKILNEIQQFEQLICDELNVKHVAFRQDEFTFVELSAKPNLPILGKALGPKMPQVKNAILKLTTGEIKNLEQQDSITIEGITLPDNALLINRTCKPEFNGLSNARITTILDISLNPALIQEGYAREIISQVQKTRKDLDLNVAQRIEIIINGDKETLTVFEQHGDMILTEVLGLKWHHYDAIQKHLIDCKLEGSFTIIPIDE